MEKNQKERDEPANSPEDTLKELEEQIKKMEQESKDFFDELGISPHQIEDILSDRKRYSPAAYEYLQKQRQKLEDTLEERIAEVNASLKQERERENGAIKGHWIFIR
jgi:uncharacterized protein YdcH (DUF465 family)